MNKCLNFNKYHYHHPQLQQQKQNQQQQQPQQHLKENYHHICNNNFRKR